MRRISFFVGPLVATGMLVVFACAPEPKVPTCGNSCPAGGELTTEAEAQRGVTVGGNGSLVTQTANASFAIFGNGDCKFACKFAACPPGTSPDITLDHFKCDPAPVATAGDAGSK